MAVLAGIFNVASDDGSVAARALTVTGSLLRLIGLALATLHTRVHN